MQTALKERKSIASGNTRRSIWR